MQRPFLCLLPLIVLLVLLDSCTIEKRLYTKGWSVERHHRYTAAPPEPDRQPVRDVAMQEENSAFPEKSTALQSQQARPEQLTVPEILAASESTASSAVEVRLSPAHSDDTIPEVKKTKRFKRSDEPLTKERKRTAVVVAGVLMALSLVAAILVFLAFLTAEELIISMLFLPFAGMLVILAAVFLLVMIAAASREVAGSEKKASKKERSPKDAAVLKRRAGIVMGIFVAAIAAIIVILHVS